MREAITLLLCLIIVGITLQTGLLRTGMDYATLEKEKINLQENNDRLSEEIQQINHDGNFRVSDWTAPQRLWLAKTNEVLNNQLADSVRKEVVVVDSSETSLEIILSSDFLFNPDGSTLRQEARPVLLAIGRAIASGEGVETHVAGYPDNRTEPVQRDRHNGHRLNLTLLQASAVTSFFEDESGVNPNTIVTTGFARQRPFLLNPVNAKKTKNCQISISLTPLMIEKESVKEKVSHQAERIETDTLPVPGINPTASSKPAQTHKDPQRPFKATEELVESIGEEALDNINNESFHIGYEKSK